jgi:two-component system, sensor histidine kinase ChiS
MNRQLPILLSMIGVFCVITWISVSQWISPSVGFPKAEGGVLDASQWNFAEQGFFPLRGEWEFYEGMLLEPDDFRTPNESLAESRRLVQVPGGWKNIVQSDPVKGYGAGTYRLLVELNDSDIYSLRAKMVRMSSRVFIAGVDLGGNGRPAVTEEHFVASNIPFFGSVQAEAGKVEIIIQMASFKFMEGGLVQTPEFGLMQDILERRDHSRFADMIVLTMLLVFAMYYAGIFRQWHKEPYLMHFCLFCLTTGLFLSLDNEILASTVIDLPFMWLQKLLYFLPLLSFYFFLHYVYRYLGERENPFFIWLRRCYYVSLFLIVVLPNRFLFEYILVDILLQMVTLGTILYAIFKSRSRGEFGSLYMLLGLFFLIASWLYTQLHYILALDNPYYMVIIPLLLVFSQAFLMSDRLQNAFRRNERLTNRLLQYDRQKDDFLAKTSHELRTPLHGIVNLSQSLLDNRVNPLQEEHRDNIRMLHLMGRRMVGLVHDILDMNRIRNGQFSVDLTSVNVGQSVGYVLETLAITSIHKEVELVNDLPSTLPLVWADENRLRQILYNLLENGLKYTKKGSVRISAERHGNELAISVTDTGMGIPAKMMESLFQPFVQTERRPAGVNSGLGLGLAISKELVELQGGQLEVESKVGSGSRFTFTLPIDSASEEVAVAAVRGESAVAIMPMLSPSERGEEIHVLIVDDKPSNVKVLIDVINSLKYGYTAAGSGEEALAVLGQSSKPDLVLLDLMMPDISGLDVCRTIRSMHGLAELPVLMLTASGQSGDILASFEAGANDILQKPFELAELKARVQSLLAMKSSSEQAVRREMDFLQAQITPHFLYNSLNALVGLSYTNVDRLRETIYHLTTYLRAKFTFVFEGELIPFEKELELVKAYLAIEKLRFGDRLEFRCQLEEGLHCMLPPLSLQPIVENAVRHGIGPKPSGGYVQITAIRNGDGVDIIVEDDGVGMDEDVLHQLNLGKNDGVGVDNVNRRWQMRYGRKLDIRSKLGEGTRITMRLPEGNHDQSDNH